MNIDDKSRKRGVSNSLAVRRRQQAIRREKVVKLNKEGHTIAAIARHLNVSRSTIEKDLDALGLR